MHLRLNWSRAAIVSVLYMTVMASWCTAQPAPSTTEPATSAPSTPVSPEDIAYAFRTTLVSGLGMVVVAAASLLYFRKRLKTDWRWFGVGAAVWTVGVILKFAWAVPLNKTILHGLEQAMPAPLYQLVAALYIGLLTGVFEIGITLVAGLLWKKLSADSSRAIAVGVGAGVFEALLIGLRSLSAAAVLLSGLATEQLVGEVRAAAQLTFLAWLCGPVERLIAILCHISSRALTLLTIATGRWRYFWSGFALMTALDGVAGYYLLTGQTKTLSIWWIELTIAPFAVLSIPLIRCCLRRWPTTTAAAVEAERPAEPPATPAT
ncbi:MAG TPA: YhfC family glutamic-type intramembrane protease [Phycisphaerae bacterium]|nr:YhfC family glutamic-type intramembrane protease [Phycisphaerae bacterium]